jgi:hypothetical protein
VALPLAASYDVGSMVILSLFMYGCETWFYTLRQERRSRVFESRAPRRIFGPVMEEVMETWKSYVMRSMIHIRHCVLLG